MDTRLLDVASGRARVRLYEGGNGPDLVFLHGAGGLLPDDPFLAALAQHYHVVAPVLPGYEDSSGEEQINDMLEFALHGWDVVAELGLTKPILAGHCMGGMVAAEMAALAHNDVERLLLLAPAGMWLDEHPVADLFTALPFELPGLLLADPQKNGHLLASGGNFNDPDFLADFMVGNAKRLGMASKVLFPIPERGLSRRCYRIKADCLLLWGDSDRLIEPVYAEEFLRHLPRARLASIADAGHMLHYEQTGAVVRAITEFLQ